MAYVENQRGSTICLKCLTCTNSGSKIPTALRRFFMEFRDPFATAQGYAPPQEAVSYDAGLRAYMLRIYNYMSSALALTGIVAMLAANSPAFLQAMYNVQDGHAVGMSGLGWLIMFAPVGLVLW